LRASDRKFVRTYILFSTEPLAHSAGVRVDGAFLVPLEIYEFKQLADVPRSFAMVRQSF
jgi:hypothetical protein